MPTRTPCSSAASGSSFSSVLAVRCRVEVAHQGLGDAGTDLVGGEHGAQGEAQAVKVDVAVGLVDIPDAGELEVGPKAQHVRHDAEGEVGRPGRDGTPGPQGVGELRVDRHRGLALQALALEYVWPDPRGIAGHLTGFTSARQRPWTFIFAASASP